MSRIVLVTPTFPKLYETFIVNKYLGLLDAGWDVHVVCQTRSDAVWPSFAGLRAELRRRVHVDWPHRPQSLAAMLLPFVVLRGLLRHPGAVRSYLGQGELRRYYLDARLAELRPALVHFEFGSLAAARMAVGELLGCRVVVSFRGFDLNYVGLDRPGYYDAVWRRADGLHFLGEDLWCRARRRGCPEDVCHTLIAPAIDPQLFAPEEHRHHDATGGPRRPLRILSVGRLEWKKGYEYAFEAVRRLVDRGVRCSYRVIGDGRLFEALSFIRHQLELEDVVELLGAVEPERVGEEMRRADVFLHAAVSEGFCNAVLEAQSMELPVVTSDADGLAENVAHGVSGFVVPRRDPQALADHLARLAADPELRRHMGEAGRQRVLHHFRLDQQIAAFSAFYRQVLELESRR